MLDALVFFFEASFFWSNWRKFNFKMTEEFEGKGRVLDGG